MNRRRAVRPRGRPIALVGLIVLAAGCGGPVDNGSATKTTSKTLPVAAPPVGDAKSGVEPSPFRFRDASAASGIDFVLCSGNDTEKHFPTSLGSGVSMLDYDGDGRLDLFFPSTRNLPFSAADNSAGCRLYRNLGRMKFEDVTAKAGVGLHGFFHCAGVGDIDNDGRPDLLLTGLGPLVLLRNNGDGTFRDASSSSGLVGPTWSSAAAFLDYDGDGRLDVYVSSYGAWDPAGPHEFCGDKARNLRVICSPFSITPARHWLFRNTGDGRFEESTGTAGILRTDGRGLGVVAADVNGDDRTDIYVANDGCPNFLFLNRGDGTFEDATESSGAAVDESGQVQGSMGVDIQDVDGDARPELVVTNFRGQPNTIYKNLDGRTFQDVSAVWGIVKDSRPLVGWGCALADFDNDGWPDFFVVNGEVDDNLRQFGQPYDYDEPPLLYRNDRGRRFVTARSGAGDFFTKTYPARGAAFGDLDDDGDLDIVVTSMDRRAILLVNESPGNGGWIRFKLEGRRSNRPAIGATVIVSAAGRTFTRAVRGGDSYLSANDPRPLIGIGKIDKVDRVEVRWPSGARTSLENPAIGRTHNVVEPETAR